MGLFRPYDQKTSASQAASQPAPEPVAVGAPTTAAPKNRPTPTRQQAQAARMEALHPKLTKRQVTAQDRAAAEKKRTAQMQAEDNKPERVLLRNYVDSRLAITQFILPIMLIVFAGSMGLSKFPAMTMALTIFLYAVVLACVVTCWLFWQGFKRELAERVPSASTKGLLMMLVSRMMMIPRMRQPPPAVKRGESY
ncbi:MAG: DUF3043 domain-containing protein [Propionibacteriaceae bacterium]|nr:DUF3043 domain-containing protein [Propionibacteriaceae bacterium]